MPKRIPPGRAILCPRARAGGSTIFAVIPPSYPEKRAMHDPRAAVWCVLSRANRLSAASKNSNNLDVFGLTDFLQYDKPVEFKSRRYSSFSFHLAFLKGYI